MLVLVVIAVPATARTQSADTLDSKQWLFTSTKVAYAVNKWRFFGDMQFRLNENWRELDQWLVELSATYSPTSYLELSPDFRVTVRPSRIEYRPGAGAILKTIVGGTWQFALQHKYQFDISSVGGSSDGLRQVGFVNKVVGDHLIFSAIGGWFYRWRDNWNGVEFVRVGAGVTYRFNVVHGLNVSYFVGKTNLVDHWITDGFLAIGLTINIRTDWTYVPAGRIVNF